MMKFKTLLLVFFTLLFASNTVLAAEYEVSVTVSPKQFTVAPYGIANFDIIVKNLGEMDDVYGITVDGIPEEWYSLSQESISLEAGKSKTVYLFITPYYFERKSFTVTVSAVGQSSDSDTFTLNIVPEREIRVSLPKQITSCLCEEDEATIVVENLGIESSEDIVLSLSGDAVDIVEVESMGFTLGPGETKEVPLKIESICGEEEGSYSLEVEAKSMSSYAKSTASSRIDKIKCYDFEAYYPEEVSACAGVSTSFEIEIENTGTKEDTYEVGIEDLNFSKTVTLEPGESERINVSVKEDEPGTYDIGFVVNSTFFEKTGTVEFIAERCYAVDLEVDEPELSIKSGTGRLTKPRITNLGTKRDKFEISSDVGWVAIKPKEVDLEPNETKNVYVYYSPEFGLKGTVETKLTAESENSFDEETVTVEIVEGVPPVEETTTTTEVTVPEVPEITIPETPTIPTGLVPRLIKNKLFLSILIGFILALIILGLIYSFVMRG